MRAVTRIRRTQDNKTVVFAKRLGKEERSKDINCSYDEFLDAVHSYTRGVLIQDAFHFLSADDREFIMSGLTSKEYNELFDEEEDC